MQASVTRCRVGCICTWNLKFSRQNVPIVTELRLWQKCRNTVQQPASQVDFLFSWYKLRDLEELLAPTGICKLVELRVNSCEWNANSQAILWVPKTFLVLCFRYEREWRDTILSIVTKPKYLGGKLHLGKLEMQKTKLFERGPRPGGL